MFLRGAHEMHRLWFLHVVGSFTAQSEQNSSIYKTAGREELAVYFTSRKRSTRLRLRLTRQPPLRGGRFVFTRLRLRLTCQPPLRGGRRSPNSLSPGFAFGSPASRRCAAGAARRTRFSISNFREYCTLLYYFLQIF